MLDPDLDVDANELAGWLGITTTAVRDAARRGVLDRSKIGFALKENVQKYCAHLRKLVVERSEGPAAAARARLLAEQAETALASAPQCWGPGSVYRTLVPLWNGVQAS